METVQRVLLITLDTTRADALGCYGFPKTRAQTPYLDSLATDGTLFRRAVCQIPATLTSHTAIMTGRLPRSNGVRFATDRVPDDLVTIAETCQQAGYSTGAFLSASVLNRDFNLSQGFDEYADLSSSTASGLAERNALDTTDLALEWLQARTADEPFLLWVHYYDPHSPYKPGPEDDIYGPEGYSGPIDGSADQVTRLIAQKGAGLSEQDLARLRALYLGDVTYMDRQIGRLLEAFDALEGGLPSMVVAVGDHGENLGEDGRYFHGEDLYETCMHVPLIVRWPGVQHAGTHVEELVLAMDVMPTILAACRLEWPREVEARNLHLHLEEPPDGKASERAGRVALLETEHNYSSEADKTHGASVQHWKWIDKRYHRRGPVLVGRAVRQRIEGPCYVRALIRGDTSAQLAVHVRYLTEATAQSTDEGAIEKLPTILVNTVRFGTEPIHTRYETPSVPEGWRAVGTKDLYAHAREYGLAQGWPVDHVSIESLAVDVAGIHGQRAIDVWIDDVTLVGGENTLFDDFEGGQVQVYRDAGVGIRHLAGSRIEPGEGAGGSTGLHVAAKYPGEENIWEGSGLYHFPDPRFPVEETNLLAGRDADAIPDKTKEMAQYVDDWLKTPAAQLAEPASIDPETEEALRGLGYF